jgi:hypothetical protein
MVASGLAAGKRLGPALQLVAISIDKTEAGTDAIGADDVAPGLR